MMETVISGFIDSFPRTLRPRKTLFTLFCCFIGFLLGMPQVCKVCINQWLNREKILTGVFTLLCLNYRKYFQSICRLTTQIYVFCKRRNKVGQFYLDFHDVNGINLEKNLNELCLYNVIYKFAFILYTILYYFFKTWTL